jgi:hypothetical protein
MADIIAALFGTSFSFGPILVLVSVLVWILVLAGKTRD